MRPLPEVSSGTRTRRMVEEGLLHDEIDEEAKEEQAERVSGDLKK